MFTLGLLVGGALGAGAGYLYWGRQVKAFNERLAGLEASANQIQSERERLHHALDDILRERRGMVETAEHLRTQGEQQGHQLEALAPALVPPPAAPPPRPPPGGAGARGPAVTRLVRPLAAHPPHLALGPFDPAVVEFGYLEQVELHDLEVGGEVEVPWRYDGGELAAEDRRVGRRGA